MGNYGGIPVATEKGKLRNDLERAEKLLDDYYKCLYSPPGSSAFESVAWEIGLEERLKRKVQEAKEALRNYKGNN